MQINHPYRTITFALIPNRALTRRDKKLKALYIKMHDAEHQLRLLCDELKTAYETLYWKTLALQQELNLVKAGLAAATETVNEFAATSPPHDGNTVQELAHAINTASTAIMDFDKKVRGERNKLKALKPRESACREQSEDSTLWEQFSELKITYAYDNDMALDFVAFDDDEAQLRSHAEVTLDLCDTVLDYCTEVTQKFNGLLADTGKVYEDWQALCDQVRQLPGFPGDAANMGGFGLN